MIEQNFQKAIERLISDERYSQSLIVDPDKLGLDYDLNEKQILALKSSNVMGVKPEAVRGVSTCCCCTCSIAKTAEEINEVSVN